MVHSEMAAADELSRKWFREKAINSDMKKEFHAIKTKLINPVKNKIRYRTNSSIGARKTSASS